MTFHTSPCLSFSTKPMVPFFQASTYALEGLRGPGTPLLSGPVCECWTLPACCPTWAPGLLTAILCYVKCWEWESWSWIKIKVSQGGNVGGLPRDYSIQDSRLGEVVGR